MGPISRLALNLKSLGQRVSRHNVLPPPSVRQSVLRGNHTIQPPSPSRQPPSSKGSNKSTDHIRDYDVNHRTSGPLNEDIGDYVYTLEPLTVVPVPGKPCSWKVTFTRSWIDLHAHQPLYPATSLQISFERGDMNTVLEKGVYRRIPARKIQRNEKGVFWVVFPDMTGHMDRDGVMARVWLYMWMGSKRLGKWRLKRV